MPYTLKQAAEATGKSKPTILRAIQKGTISANKSEHGEWQIDPAELHRVYPLTEAGGVTRTASHETRKSSETEVLRAENVLLREMLADRELRVRDKEELITDLKDRLEIEAAERRTAQAQVTALLEDRRPKAPEPATTEAAKDTSEATEAAEGRAGEGEAAPEKKEPVKRRGWWFFGKR